MPDAQPDRARPAEPDRARSAEPAANRGSAWIGALALSCHPVPSLGVTVLSAGLAALAQDDLWHATAFVASVFAGQLSIGWGNDCVDAARDRSSLRADKPAAAGRIAVATLARAAGAALVLSVLFAATLGLRAGAATLVLLACGWAYNLGLKSSWWSWSVYAVGFGSLPAVATLNAPHSSWPAAWAPAAGATLGVAAHLANVLPDLTTDAATGVRGFPHRIGERGTAVGGPALLVAATALIVFGPRSGVSWPGWCAVTLSTAVGAWAMTSALRGALTSRYFRAILAVAMLDLLLFGVSGGKLT